ncbi:MAG: hypothetical protein IJ415_00305 [Clostridia bacterium]|nr:hypothetical protein [Clostridia bacterium]
MNKLNHEYVEELINKIFKQAENGLVEIGNDIYGWWKFYVQFSNNESKKINTGEPAVVIQDKNLFVSRLEKYLKVARKFYKQDKDYFELTDLGFGEKLILDLFVNATNFDLNNVEKYIEQRTQMLLDKSTECGELWLGEYLDCQIVGQIVKNKSNLESPYKFSVYLEKDSERFFLPSVHFGKIDNKLMLYALQGEKEKQENKLAKKLDRHFRKVNKDVDTEDEILSQVSPNALVSLTIFMAYQEIMGAKTAEAVNFMPIRYISNSIVGTRRLNSDEEKEEFLIQHDRNQFNISNRFFNTLIRYAHHFNLPVEYDDVLEKLNLKLSTTNTFEDNIVHSIDGVVREFLNKSIKVEL